MKHYTMSPTGAIVTADGYTAIVDICDLPAVSGYCWRMNVADGPPHYLCRKSHWPSNLYLHRVVAMRASGDVMAALPVGERWEVHHTEGNVLDNRRCVLAIVSSQAHRDLHRSHGPRPHKKFKGVVFEPKSEDKPWRGHLRVRRHLYRTRFYATEEEAAAAYDELVLAHGFDQAFLNFRKEID